MSRREQLSGSAVLFFTGNFANALHFLFHLVMARLLGPADYGALAALMAIVYVFNVGAESVQTVLTRYAAAQPGMAEVHDLLARALRRSYTGSAVLLVVYLAGGAALGRLIHLPFSLLLVFSPVVVGVALLPALRGVLLGIKRFGAFGGSLVVEVLFKLALGVGAAKLGFAVHGVAAGVALSMVAAYVLALPLLAAVRAVPRAPAETTGIYRYGLPVLFLNATVVALFSLDVLLARAFFPADVAGQYSLASLLAKAIYFGSLPIARAMFPLAAGAAGRAGGAGHVLRTALGLLAACLVPALAVFWLFPGLLVRVAAGPGYELAATVAPPLSVGLAAVSLASALLLFELSLGRSRGLLWLPLLVLVQLGALVLWHSTVAEYALVVVAGGVTFLLAAVALALLARRPHTPPG